ncbi:uncharacterized protein LOC142349216 [Convolutriloba macropyga]|uniref:uncharacterized protein LOC142349216 n=1 Tax=Convolutriloba macropyga TaxID=536237 RepID=UPI003F51B21B
MMLLFQNVLSNESMVGAMESDLRSQNQSLINQLRANQLLLNGAKEIQNAVSDRKAVYDAKQQMLSRKDKQPPSVTSHSSIRSSTPKIAQYTRVDSENKATGHDTFYLNQLENSGNIRIPPQIIRSCFRSDEATPVATLKTKSFSGGAKSNLLGYDWIAEMLDMDLSYENKSDDYFQQLRNFRELNPTDCFAVEEQQQSSVTTFISKFPLPSYVSKSELVAAQNENEHQCVHLYRMNARGFAIPVNVNDDGESICPVCKTTRQKDLKTMVRVTVPKSLLPDFDRVDVKQPGSADTIVGSKKDNLYAEYCPGDSVGLSQHVVHGWRSARPTCAAPATFVDIKSASSS